MNQAPTVGRIVHYQSFGTPGGEYKSEPRAAVITQVKGTTPETLGVVGLAILNPGGMFFQPEVRYSEVPTPGCWNWPPKI